MTAPQAPQSPSFSVDAASTLLSAGFSAATHALTAAIFTSISPLSGAIVGVSGVISGRLFSLASNSCSENTAAKAVTAFAGYIAGIAASTYLASALGFPPITFTAALCLSLGTMAAGFAVTAIVIAVVGGILYANGTNIFQGFVDLPNTSPTTLIRV